MERRQQGGGWDEVPYRTPLRGIRRKQRGRRHHLSCPGSNVNRLLCKRQRCDYHSRRLEAVFFVMCMYGTVEIDTRM